MRRLLLVERDIKDREAKLGDVNCSVADERALGEDLPLVKTRKPRHWTLCFSAASGKHEDARFVCASAGRRA
jgi:hypothetical protein